MRTTGIVILILLLIAGAVLFYYGGDIFKVSADSILKRSLPDYVKVDKLEFDLTGGSLAVKGLRILNPGGFRNRYLAEIDSLSCRFRGKGESILDGVEIYDIYADRLRINIERLSDGRINVNEMDSVMDGDRAKSGEQKAKVPLSKEPAKKGRKLSDFIRLPSDLFIRDSRVVFEDRMVAVRPYIISYDDVNGRIELELNRDYSKVYSIASQGSGILNGDVSQKIAWVIGLDPTKKDLTMSNKYEIFNVGIRQFEPYYDDYSPIVVESGKVSGTLIFNFDNGNVGSQNTLKVKGLEFKEKQNKKSSWGWKVVSISDIIRYLHSSPGEITFDFKIKGDMDNPEFFPGPHVKAAMQSMVVNKISDMIGSLSGNTEGRAAAPASGDAGIAPGLGPGASPAQGEGSDVDRVVNIIKDML